MNIKIHLDPTGAFAKATPEALLDACGYVALWMHEAQVIEDEHQPESLWDYIDECYGFPMCLMSGGSIDENGIYNYPGDPALPPVAKWITDNEMIYMYQYAILAFVDRKTGVARVTRVD